MMGDLAPDSMRDSLHLPSAQEAVDSAKEAMGLDDDQAKE